MATPEKSPKKKMGRPPKNFDPEKEMTVQAMAQYGVPYEDIAAVIDLSVDTMKKLYDVALKKGKGLANATVGERLFKKCQERDTTALIF